MMFMNFQQTLDKMQGEVFPKRYKPDAFGEFLLKLHDLYGKEIFSDVDKIAELMNSAGIYIEEKLQQQLVLLLRCSNVGYFITNNKPDVSFVDINNAIHDAIETTGLTYQTVLRLFSNIFYACGLDYSLSYGYVVDESNHTSVDLHILMPYQAIQEEYERAEKARFAYKTLADDQKNEQAEIATFAINNLCKSGAAQGFYLRGLLHLTGDCNTLKNEYIAKDNLKISSDAGYALASTKLGDIYYKQGKFTRAHYYYTRPGALPLTSYGQEALQEIYEQKDKNVYNFIMAVVMFGITIVFLLKFNSGVLSDVETTGLAIFHGSVAFFTLVGCIYYLILNRYNNIRPVVFIQFLIWASYTFWMLRV